MPLRDYNLFDVTRPFLSRIAAEISSQNYRISVRDKQLCCSWGAAGMAKSVRFSASFCNAASRNWPSMPGAETTVAHTAPKIARAPSAIALNFLAQLKTTVLRLLLTVCVLFGGPISTNAQEAQGHQYFFGNDISLKFNGYAELGLEYITPRLEDSSSSFRFSAYAEHKTQLTFRKNWSIKSVVKSQELDTRDDDDDKEGYGVTLDSLYLQYGAARYKVYAGKFQARFGLAGQTNLGKFGYDFYDYKVEEKLGFGGSIGFGDGASGSYVLSASLFTADTTVFSDSLIFERGRLKRSDGGPSNTEDLSSFAIALDGDRLPWADGVRYHVAYAHLAAGDGDQSSSDSFVFGLQNNGWQIGNDMRLEWVSEVAYVTNVDGNGDDVAYITLGATVQNGRYSLTSVYAPRFVTAQNEADDRTEQLFALSLGYSVTDNSQVILGYRYRDEENTEDNTVSVSYGFSY